MTGPFVCPSCGTIYYQAHFDRYTKRLEIRDRKQGRHRTKKMADICKRCAKQDADIMRSTRPQKMRDLPCVVCGTRTEGFNEMEKRWEYQRADRQTDAGRVTVGYLHEDCVPQLMEDEDRGEQGRLF